MNWRTVFLRAAGFGTGFAVTLAIILSLVFWYESRPKVPKPWDTKTLQVEYKGTTDSYTTDIGFRYALTNNGTEDYRIADGESVQLSMVGKNGEVTPFHRILSIDTPVFVPAGRKTLVFITMRTADTFQHQLPKHPTDAEKEEYRNAVLDYLNSKNLFGFALFDEVRRVEIDFPGGWKEPKQAQK